MLYQGARVVCAIAIFGALIGCDEIPQPQSQSQPHVHQPQSRPEPQRHVHHADESGPGGVDVQHDTHSPTVKHDWWHQHAHWEGYNLRHEHVHVLGEEHDPPESWRNPPAPAPPAPAPPPSWPPPGLWPPTGTGTGTDGEESADGLSKSWEIGTRHVGRLRYAHVPPNTVFRSRPFEWGRITGGAQRLCVRIGGAQLPLHSNNVSLSAEVSAGEVVLVLTTGDLHSGMLLSPELFYVEGSVLLVSLGECVGDDGKWPPVAVSPEPASPPPAPEPEPEPAPVDD